MTDGTVLARYSRHELEALASSEPAVALELCRIAFSTVSRLEAQLLILGRITAVEKVGAFLLDLAERLVDQELQSVALPMSRYDMAEFLSLSVETVSRALSELKYRGLIRFAGTRYITIVDREALEHRPVHERKPVYTWHCQPKCETGTSLQSRTAERCPLQLLPSSTLPSSDCPKPEIHGHHGDRSAITALMVLDHWHGDLP